MNQQLKLQHQIALIYRYFQQFLCGGPDNFDIFTLTALGREILMAFKTKNYPVHYIVGIHPTGKNFAPNEWTAQTLSPDSFDLKLNRYFKQFLCGGTENFDIFILSALGREILITVKIKRT